jgi:cytochrome c oxidase subunit 2
VSYEETDLGKLLLPTFDPVTTQGQSISNLFWLELVISAALLALVSGIIVASIVRFRVRAGDTAEPPQIDGNRRLELIWTAVPAATLLVIFGLVVATIRTVNAEQPGAQSLVVVGHQWWWEFQYPDQQAVTANELHVPVGTPLQISLRSDDVIHSFHVPQFGWMRDLVPGQTNTMQVFVDRPGVFDGYCNQYCGLQHAWMRVTVVADPPGQFAAWVQQQALPVAPSGAPGEQIFVQNTCVSCHTIRGLGGASGKVGPDLTHVGGRATLGAGVLVNTPDNMRQWISNPQAIKPGVLMPAFSSLGDAKVDALVNYLESLK